MTVRGPGMNRIVLAFCILLAVSTVTAIIIWVDQSTHRKTYVNVLKEVDGKIAEIQLEHNISHLVSSLKLMRIVYNDSLVEDYYLVNFSKKWVAECKGYTISGGEIIKVVYDLHNNSIKIEKFGKLKDIFNVSTKIGDIRINYSIGIRMPLGWQYEFRISGTSKNAVELSLASENSSIFYTTDKNVNWVSCGEKRIGWRCKFTGKLRCYASCEKNFRYVYWFRLVANSNKPAVVDVQVDSSSKTAFRIIVDQSESLRCVEYFPEANFCERVAYAPVSVVMLR